MFRAIVRSGPKRAAGSARTNPILIRDAEAGRNAERFFVTAVATLLVIRGFLAAAGYPQLGGRHLHIAHMLWGGLALTIALLLMLVSIGRRTRPVAAFLGGAGFGIFIDELGKFLTRDYDYFYRPAIALIYFVFVGIFLGLRVMLTRPALTPDERIANAISATKDLAVEDFDEEEKAQAIALLDSLDPGDPRVVAVRGFLERISPSPVGPPGREERFRAWLARRVRALLETRRFSLGIAAVVLAQAGLGLAWALVTARGLVLAAPAAGPPPEHIEIGVASWCEIATSASTAVLAAAGLVRLRRSRIAAYRLFRHALRIAVFLTQFFVFYEAQLAGVVWLAFTLALLGAVDALIRHEEPAESRLAS